MSRKLLSVMLICAFLLPLAVGVSAQSSTQAACSGTQVTVTVDDWSSSDRVEYMNQVIDAFMQANPCIKVTLVPVIGDDQNTRRLTMIATNTAPDLIGTGESWIPLYVEAGGLLDLTPYVSGSDGINPASVFQEKVYDQGFYKGKPYAIAKDYSTSAFYINKKLFDAAGIAYPKEGWNWNDALNIAEQLTLDKNGNNATSPDFDPTNIVQWGMDIKPAPLRVENRVLLVFDTSSEMKKRRPAVDMALDTLLASNLRGQMRSGDSLGVWTFDRQARTGQFPLQHWEAERAATIASNVTRFVAKQHFSKKTSFEALRPMLDQVRVIDNDFRKSWPFLRVDRQLELAVLHLVLGGPCRWPGLAALSATQFASAQGAGLPRSLFPEP